MRLVDVDKAIKKLDELKRKKEACNCSRQRLKEATAIGYAIAILKKLEVIEYETK